MALSIQIDSEPLLLYNFGAKRKNTLFGFPNDILRMHTCNCLY